MEKLEYCALVKEFAGDYASLGFFVTYEIEKSIKIGSELKLKVNTSNPLGADLRKGDIVTISGFMGDGELNKFAVSDKDDPYDGNWDVPMRFLSSM